MTKEMASTETAVAAARQDAFAAARELQWLWKTEAMKRMALALAQLALDSDEFAADDLPAAMDHGGSGIAGSVFAVLVNNGLIERQGVRIGDQFYGKERVSKRAGRKDAKLKVFKLADATKTRAFLQAEHHIKELHQKEMSFA